jgi:hypothetical protein
MDNNATFSDADLQGKQEWSSRIEIALPGIFFSPAIFVLVLYTTFFCLLTALEMFLMNVQGVRVNHGALKATLGESSRNLAGVLSLVKNMDVMPEEERIFVIEGGAGTTAAGITSTSTGTTVGK